MCTMFILKLVSSEEPPRYFAGVRPGNLSADLTPWRQSALRYRDEGDAEAQCEALIANYGQRFEPAEYPRVYERP